MPYNHSAGPYFLPSHLLPESFPRPPSQRSKERRLSFTTGLEFLATGRPASSHQGRKGIDSPNKLANKPDIPNKLRKCASMEVNQGNQRRAPRPRINTTIRAKSSFSVSSPQAPITYIQTLSSPSALSAFCPHKIPIMEQPIAPKQKKPRSYGAFIRKLLSCTKKRTLENQSTVTKTEVQPQKVTPGTGSELRDLRFYLGNESLRICRRLCRIQDEDEKSFHILSSRIGSLNFNVRQFDSDDASHTLLLPATVFDNEADEAEQGMMNVFMENFISILPFGTDKISRKANPSSLVFRLLPSPIIQPAARYLGAAFWLWLCAIDDQIEELEQKDFEEAIEEIKRVFTSQEPLDPGSRVTRTSFALRDLVQQTELTPASAPKTENQDTWRYSFLEAIMEILYAFEGERPLLNQFKKADDHVKLTDWMVLRIVTISARPFMVLARASLGLQPGLSQAGNTAKGVSQDAPTRRGRSDSARTFTPDLEWEEEISRLEVLAQCAMGLENDILGWEKDHAEGNILNSVEILFQTYQHRQSAMREMVLIHNYTVNQLCLQADILLPKYSSDNSTPPISPTRTLFNVKTPRTPFPLSPTGTFISPIGSPADTEHTNKFLGLIKGKVNKPGQGGELAPQAQYIMVLLGFVKGMAIWTSKAKRYAV
ncbi:hypothetical protein TWF225_010020 [Orbilia oligospora]|nr:hypothetical protein TWF225_010020 [Orbilia oligospora]KAF3271199.1 hypothetical protein TWF217_005609 [Orbilia oligospora]KAF3271748.1 hypothetical protein TWF128_000295 [Orbilia oligospora]KAF3271749.1 hypothetical protein TWF128_000295 [Orbilia oligospora]KAF3271750.1 hypothetical protein TWF128_000295 [Orbilia oligospora]